VVRVECVIVLHTHLWFFFFNSALGGIRNYSRISMKEVLT